MDLNYQSMAGSASLLLHPARYYVGVKCSHHFAPEDSPVPLQVVVARARRGCKWPSHAPPPKISHLEVRTRWLFMLERTLRGMRILGSFF